MDYYIFSGPSPKQVVETYAWLTGNAAAAAAAGSLGFQQSRYSYMPQSRLMEIATRSAPIAFPADALYLDIDYQDRNRPFTVDSKAFPDSAAVVGHAPQNELPCGCNHRPAHRRRCPSQVTRPTTAAWPATNSCNEPDGTVYVGEVWPGPASFPTSRARHTRAWWGTLYKPFRADGLRWLLE